MTIGFFFVDAGTKAAAENALCARALVQSVKDVMPYTPIVQFTDMTTKAIKGVNAVRRKPSEPMALLRMRHHAGVKGPWVFVDTDVIFQQPVSAVMKPDFDIGITGREWSHVKAAVGFSTRMPYNTGVVFSKCPAFWQEVYCRLKHYPPELQQWMGDQEVIAEIVDEDVPRYHVRKLNGRRFNFPPVINPEDESPASRKALLEAAIVHYKGAKRKPLLLARIKEGARLCA